MAMVGGTVVGLAAAALGGRVKWRAGEQQAAVGSAER